MPPPPPHHHASPPPQPTSQIGKGIARPRVSTKSIYMEKEASIPIDKEDSIQTEKEAAPAGGAATPDWLRLDLYLVDGYGFKEQRMVKMDHRNGYIKWLLEWDKKPRPPLPNLPEECREAMDAIKAQRDHDEGVLAGFKRDGYAYVQVDVFNDDDPRANLPDHHYDIIHDDSDEVGQEAERILGRL
ncbi:hypothetical protein CFC21_099727 [Triticum aestivum]|uniref:Uncharacterized protein n=2 Tax=Triticum aestivum TaxID=4565 RepID=A0A3B6RM49_WHEAT|nr:hypothetical protein CFC21_099727 [Triticum aestivum]